MSDPDIKARFTPHILDITQALTRLGSDGKAEQVGEQPDTKPPAGDAKLLRHIAGAIHSTLYGPRGDDTTRRLATTAAHAVLSVRDLEVMELRRSLAISRKRTEHFAALYSEALDELEDIAP